jgi:hypothetical protein
MPKLLSWRNNPNQAGLIEYKRLGGAPFNFAFHVKNLGTPVCINLRPHCFTKQIIAGIKGKQNEKA